MFNTWVGEPSKLVLLEAVLDTIVRDQLLARVTEVGAEMLAGLEQLAARHPGVWSAVRGRGTFCAVDCDSGARRDEVSCDWWRPGHVTTLLTSDWSRC